MSAFDDAVAELYQAPLDAFVETRKRLAKALKDGGEREASSRLAKLPRPPVSAWAVNQLHWKHRDAFDLLFETAERVRRGETFASTAHRDATNALRDLAKGILEAAGHGATEATLRRVATTLAALAAHGGFAPDPPGACTTDRDPPGFDVLSAIGPPAPVVDLAGERAARAERAAIEAKTKEDDTRAKEEALRAKEEALRAKEEAERREREAKRKAEISRLDAALRDADRELATRAAAVTVAGAGRDRAVAALREAELALAEAERLLADGTSARDALADARRALGDA